MTADKILVIGAKGQLGRELMEQGSAADILIAGIDIDELDITNQRQVWEYFKDLEVSLIVNAAAYTAVDRAEKEPDAAFAANRDAAGYLAKICKNKSIPLIHISTDYVFDGLKNGPYIETDPVSPVGVYARSKAEGERRVVEILDTHIIIRTAWLYGVYGGNFVKTMLRLGRERPVLQVVSDQHGCPTSAEDLAGAVLQIAQRLPQMDERAWGIYHYCGQGETTWHAFAETIFEMASAYDNLAVKQVDAIPTSAYPTPAKRPLNSVLNCEKIEKTFGAECRPWEESLSRTIDRIYSLHSAHQ